MSLLYKCERCTLTHDHEVVPQEQQVIGAIIHLVWPFEAVGGKDTVYLCSDCFKEMRTWIKESRAMYEDMAEKAKEQAEVDYDNHDHKGAEHGCVCESMDDGYGKDVA